MTVGEIIVLLVVGGLVGWIASILMKTNRQMGILANIGVGIVGAAIGKWLAPKLGIIPSGDIATWAVMIAGAVLLILLLRVLGVFK